MYKKEIAVDEEFSKLIPPLSNDEYKQLEENILEWGCLTPIQTWEEPLGFASDFHEEETEPYIRYSAPLIIDGHNRYKICTEHDIPYETTPMFFEDRNEAKLWIINNQLGRRNISLFDRVTLEDQKKQTLAEQARDKVSSGGGDRKSEEYKKSANEKSCYPIDPKEKNKINRQNTTDYKIAKNAGTSEDTVRKVRAINNSGDEKLIEEVRSGEKSINQGFLTVKGVSDKSPKKAHQEFIQQIKKEHEDFKEQKTVDIQDIQRDKDNRQVLATDVYTRLLRMGNAISAMTFDISNKNINAEEVAKEFSEEQKQTILTTLSDWKDQLDKLAEVFT